MRVFSSFEEIEAATGEEIGTTDWVEITQERVDQFAEATGDHQWIHVDVEKAKDGLFGGTIAHGYLTLSLVPWLGSQVFELDTPGAKLRLGVEIKEIDELAPGQAQATYLYTFEVEGAAKPSCVAEVIVRLYE